MAILSIALLSPVREIKTPACPEGQIECPKTSTPETIHTHVARPSGSLNINPSYSRVSKTDLQKVIDQNIPKGLA